MNGLTDLASLLANLSPSLDSENYVFTCTDLSLEQCATYDPLVVVQEDEAVTLILKQEDADMFGFEYDGVFSRITLTVHSSLDAVGLTAVVSTALADSGISANVIAGFYHDHVFVQAEHSAQAMAVLNDISVNAHAD